MKYLIINDKYESGGAEIYARNLKNMLDQKEQQCALLTFDSKYNFSQLPADEYFNLSLSLMERYISKVTVHWGLVKKIKKIVSSFSPDLIIVNNLFDTKFSLLYALKSYKAIRIIHDYSPFCIHSSAVYDNGSLCSVGYKAGKCNINCSQKGKIYNQLKKWNYERVECLSKQCFSMFISPSNDLTTKLKNYGYNAYCLNNFLFADLSSQASKSFISEQSERIYLYVGKINYFKGILDFIPYWNEFHKVHGGKLWIVGTTESETDWKKLSNSINRNSICYLGLQSHQKVIKLMNQAYCVLVPSRWAENYPTVILEAMFSGSLIIGSSRGGIPEMLDNKRGLLFHWEQPQTIIDALVSSANMSKFEYNTYSQNAFQYISTHTSDVYIDQLFSMLKAIL